MLLAFKTPIISLSCFPLADICKFNDKDRVIEILKFHFAYEMHPHVCSETAEHVRQRLSLITPSQPGEMHYKAPGTAESSTGPAGSQRKNSCAQELPSLAQDSAAWQKGKRLNKKQEIPLDITP